jgi:hypothetical protein
MKKFIITEEQLERLYKVHAPLAQEVMFNTPYTGDHCTDCGGYRIVKQKDADTCLECGATYA